MLEHLQEASRKICFTHSLAIQPFDKNVNIQYLVIHASGQ